MLQRIKEITSQFYTKLRPRVDSLKDKGLQSVAPVHHHLRDRIDSFRALSLAHKRRIFGMIVAVLLLLAAGVKGVPLLLPPHIVSTFPGTTAENIPLDSAIEIIFDRGMDRASVEKSFQIVPTVTGRFQWEGYQRLIFKPMNLLQRSQKYTVTFGGTSRFRIPLIGLRSIVFETVGNPKVMVFSPATTAADDYAPVSVVFDRPMIALTASYAAESRKPAFTIEPAITGEGRWLGTTAYQFRPSQPFKKSTTYTVQIAKLAARDGSQLQAHSWQFSSQRPLVEAVSPLDKYQYASATASVSAVLNQPADLDSLKTHFALYDNNNQQITGRIITNSRVFGFYPDSPLQRVSTYRAVLRQGLQSTEGPNGLAQDYTWTFKVAPKPEVISSTPANSATNITEQHQIEVKFRTPMDSDSFAGNVSIDPSPAKKPTLDFYNYQDEHTLSIGTYLSRSQTYTITISGNVKDQYGSTLGTPYIIKFSTAAYKPSIIVYPNGTYFGAFNQEIMPRVVVQTINAKHVDYSIYKLEKSDLLMLYRRRYQDECGSNLNCRNWQDFSPKSLEKIRTWYENYDADTNVPVNVVTQVTDANGDKLSSGFYYLEVSIPQGPHDNMVMVVTRSALTVKRSPNQVFAWVVNQSSGAVRDGMHLELTDSNGSSLLKGDTNNDGVLMQDIDLSRKDNLFVFGEKDGDITVASSAWDQGIEKYDFGLPSYYNSTQSVGNGDTGFKLYLLLDRPIFRPGQKVYFKGVIRKDDDNDYENIPPNQQVLVTIADARGREVYRQNLHTTTFGSFSGEFNISPEANLGNYGISAKYSGVDYSQTFQVEEYKKPDLAINVTTTKDDFVNGETGDITVNAAYYFGSPVADSPVKYTLNSHDYFFSWDKDYRFEFGDPDSYWTQWWSAQYPTSKLVTDGSGKTDIKGMLALHLPFNITKDTASQVMTLEATVQDKNNTAVAASQQFVVHKGGLYAGIHPVSYANTAGSEAKVELVVLDLKHAEVPNTTATVEFYKRTWTTIREQSADDNNYYYTNTPTDTLVSTTTVKTGASGYAVAAFTPSDGGTYRVTAKVTDLIGNTNKSSAFIWVAGSGFTVARENNDRTVITADRRDYLVDDTARIFVATPFATESAKTLLTAERGKVIDYKIVDTTQTNAAFDLTVNSTWVPNVFIGAVLVKGGNQVKNPAELRVGYTAINVADNSKALAVSIATNKNRYNPRDTLSATITTKNKKGTIVPAELAIGLVDKAVWDLAEAEIPDIYKVFYEPRSLQVDTSHLLTISIDRVNANTNLGAKGGSGGGCFTGETPILLPGGATKPIQTIKPGDLILTRRSDTDPELVTARVSHVLQHQVDRYLIINGDLRVTPVHRLWVNNQWLVAGAVENGDRLTTADGREIIVYSIENVTGNFTVYNLEVEQYHTFFAGGVYAHNQKGGFDTTRRNFPDTAYWNPHLKTDDQGIAKVQIKLPDSLTTWRLAAIANNESSAFGQSVKEVMVSRDVLIRPFIPRFLAIGDQAKLGGILVNSSGASQTLTLRLEADGLDLSGDAEQQVTLADGQQAKIVWSVTAQSRPQTKIRLTAKDAAGTVRDSVENTIPIYSYYTTETVATSGQAKDAAQEKLVLPKDAVPGVGSLQLNMSPALGASSLQSLHYLSDYPYYCTEQIASKVLPAVMALRLLKQAGVEKLDTLDAKNLRQMVSSGVQRLNSAQHADGGWGWWAEYDSDAFFTAYAYSALYEAKQAGFAVADSTLNKAYDYLTYALANQTSLSAETQTYILYALRSSHGNRSAYATNLFNRRYELSLQARAQLATAMMQMSGMRSAVSTLIDELVSQAKKTATTTHWEDKRKGYFLRSNPAVTASVLETLVAYDHNHPLIPEATRYLLTARKDDHWSSTYDTAQVISTLANLVLSAKSARLNESYTVNLNGSRVTSGNFSSADLLKMRSVLIGMSQLSGNQDNTLSIIKSGQGNLYYDLNLTYALPEAQIPPLEQGLVVERELVDSDGKKLADTGLDEGSDAWVRLTVVVPEERNYVILEDKLPAGLEAVNESLKNTNSISNIPPAPRKGDEILYFNHKEYRDDRVTLFTDHLAPGIYEVSYRVHATVPGRFHRPPVAVYQLYQPDVAGHSSGGWFEVKEK